MRNFSQLLRKTLYGDPCALFQWCNHQPGAFASSEIQTAIQAIDSILRDTNSDLQVNALILKGIIHASGTGVAPDRQLAIQCFKEAEQRGSIQASAYLGSIYQEGLDGHPDYVTAKKWYEVGAAKGCPIANNHLGYLYQHGLGVKQDPMEAMAYYQKAIDGQYPMAMYHRAMMLKNPDDSFTDIAMALELLERAASLGSRHAYRSLGCLYRLGIQVPRSLDKAQAYYDQAIEYADPEAMYGKAKLLIDSDSSERDLIGDLLKQSSVAGFIPAQIQLQEMGLEEPITREISYDSLTTEGDSDCGGEVMNNAIFSLKEHIQALRQYGKKLQDGGFDEKGGIVCNFANQLDDELDGFFQTSTGVSFETFKDEYKAKMNDAIVNSELNKHRAIVYPILLNGLIMATVIGFFLILYRALQQIHNEGKWTFNHTFFNAKTHSQRLKERVFDAFNDLDRVYTHVT